MKTVVIANSASAIALALVLALGSSPAMAQEESEATEAESPPEATPSEANTTAAAEVYTPADFARFKPRNALDMLNQVPGFVLQQQNQGRGLGQANENVLLNGERLASKSDGVAEQLSRISSSRVVRIEIGDGSKFGIPGLSGQVANVITKKGSVSGRFEYRATMRPEFAKDSYGGGEVSLSGSTGNIDWTAAYSHGVGRGGAGGNRGTRITDGTGTLTETREKLIWFKGEFPQLSGRLKWTGPDGTVANFSGNYSRQYIDFSNDEYRHPIGGVGVFRDFHNRERGYSYDLSGDVDFAFGPGRLKLIGIERFGADKGPSTSLFIYDDGRPDTGSRFYTDGQRGERIVRAEYRWDMLGGNWQIDGEGAFNRLEQAATLSVLNASGDYVDVPFPGATGGVTEDRYEAIITHNRSLGKGLTLQIGAGGEYSKIAQSGTGGLTREFWRPKGSLTLAWTPQPGLDTSLKLARTVSQLSFGAFLANVNLQSNNQNAGNVLLVPQQAWEADLEVKKNFKAWGSATVRAYARLIEDYIDIIPVPGGESPGNIAGKARLLGLAGNATLNLDPIGWKGAKITSSLTYEATSLPDPLTGIDRPFSSQRSFRNDTTLRWDVPKSDWAFGVGFNATHSEQYVRLSEVGREWEGPVYTYAFIENKDVFGLTVNLNVFNPTNGGHAYFKRTVWSGLRDRSPVLFNEDNKGDVSQIFRLTVRGSF